MIKLLCEDDKKELEKKIAEVKAAAAGGMSTKALNLLATILRNATYLPGSDQNSNITTFVVEMQKNIESGGESNGDSDGDETTYYAITYNLTDVESESDVAAVEYGQPYSTVISSNYAEIDVTVTMGGVDVTSAYYNDETGEISIDLVTGDIVITASGVAAATIKYVGQTGWAAFDDTSISWTFANDGAGPTIVGLSSNMAGGVLALEWDAAILEKMDMSIRCNRASFTESEVTKALTQTNTSPNVITDLVGCSDATYWLDYTESSQSLKNPTISGGKATITIPDGYIPLIMLRRNMGGTQDTTIVGSNTLFDSWIESGGVSIVQKGGVIDG